MWSGAALGADLCPGDTNYPRHQIKGIKLLSSPVSRSVIDRRDYGKGKGNLMKKRATHTNLSDGFYKLA